MSLPWNEDRNGGGVPGIPAGDVSAGGVSAGGVWARALGDGLRRAGRAVLDAVLPPRCLACAALVGAPGTLCPPCWEGVTFLAPPLCARCGLPFELDPGPDALCGGCARGDGAFRRARGVLRYDDASRALVLRFKHGDRTEAAPAFARWMARAGAELLAQADMVAPVPLHRWRLWRRRYNQAALLAAALGRASGLVVVPDLLLRRRATPSMGRMSRQGRARNVRGAFAVAERHRERVPGRTVLLIDDVLTSGATVNECARVLRRAGAAAVDVLTLARVV